MHSFAQTNIQLWNQISHGDRTEADLNCIQAAHSLAMQLFSGYFRSSGKVFIAHLIGTASILESLPVPMPLVAAGLLHAAYEYGDFGDGRKRGSSGRRRQRLAQWIGEEIEAYVFQYSLLVWTEQTIASVHQKFDQLSAMERDVLLIRMANELEEYLDYGLLYCGALKQQQYSHYAHQQVIELAEKLEQPALAAALTSAFTDLAAAQVATELRAPEQSNASYVVIPKSCQEQFWIRLRYTLANGKAYLAKLKQGLGRLSAREEL